MYKSCNIVKHGLCFFDDALACCCFSPNDQIHGQLPPILIMHYNGEILTKEELFSKIHKYSDVFKNGGCPKECTNCYHIEEKDWDDEDYIDYITITHFSRCNADCIYCSNNLDDDERTNDTYPIIPVLKYFKEQGIIKKGCELHIGGGEFTIYKEQNELLELFAINNFAKVYVPTNAIAYSPTLFKAMNEAKTIIIVSLDCGCRKTYKKIKRIDAFDKVISSLTQYARTEKSSDAIRLKYIIVPTYNDNIKEFQKFLNVAKKLHVTRIIIDIDGRYSRLKNNNIDGYFITLAEKMRNLADNQGFKTEFYSFYYQSVNNKNYKRDNFFKEIFKRINYKYFDKQIKGLYTDHKYDLKRRKIAKRITN